jgi:hypothetical protein
MASSRLTSLALLFVVFSVAAQPVRVRGVITAFEGKTLTVDGKTQVTLDEKTEIVFTQPVAFADIAPGDFLGVTSTRRPDGTLSAVEIRRFPKPVNPGHRPLDGRDDQTMTNATVAVMVEAASGDELTLTYPGGAQKVVVPAGASVSTLVPGDRTQLVRGAPVSLTHDASRVALRIQVGPKK